MKRDLDARACVNAKAYDIIKQRYLGNDKNVCLTVSVEIAASHVSIEFYETHGYDFTSVGRAWFNTAASFCVMLQNPAFAEPQISNRRGLNSDISWANNKILRRRLDGH